MTDTDQNPLNGMQRRLLIEMREKFGNPNGVSTISDFLANVNELREDFYELTEAEFQRVNDELVAELDAAEAISRAVQ